MEVMVMNRDFINLGYIDTYESMIWVERYNKPGDFELYTKASIELLDLLKINYYLFSKESDYVMIIENIEISTDAEDGNHLIVTGRSLESMLDRRIVWVQTYLNSKFQYAIIRLLNENVISPSDPKRKISRFVAVESTNQYILDQKVSKQYTGDNLLEVIQELCDEFEIGFRVTLSEDNKFVFSLYYGEDRSYEQFKNPYVIFSPTFENLLESNYKASITELKNVALIAGEDDGKQRRTVTVGDSSDLDRREMYVDARDIQSERRNEEGEEIEPIPEEEYNTLLVGRGNEKMKDYKYKEEFDASVEPTQTYLYGKDYFMGDIVQLENEFGMESQARITELLRSHDNAGYTVVPTFTVKADDYTWERRSK